MKYLILIVSMFVIAGCQESSEIANPASEFCEKNGGSLLIVNEPDGQKGICTLKDGTKCDEWAYYRGECPK